MISFTFYLCVWVEGWKMGRWVNTLVGHLHMFQVGGKFFGLHHDYRIGVMEVEAFDSARSQESNDLQMYRFFPDALIPDAEME